MMIKPGITELDRCVDSRYTLVSMVAKRARMIGLERKAVEDAAPDGSGYDPNLEKPVTQAVNEIADGVVGYVRSEAIEKAKEYEEEKFEAIMQLEKGVIDIEPEQTPEEQQAEEEPKEEMSLLDAALAAAAAKADETVDDDELEDDDF
ncbi:MAG: DNA-directed RNA polymerase subunit omega [Candidatus Ornithomonoglobus sp.]